jgi:hypothetical protein
MPLKTLEKPVSGIEIFAIDWGREYLSALNDGPGILVSFTSAPGINVTLETPIGSVLPRGVLQFRVDVGGTVDQEYLIQAKMRSTRGREKPVEILVRVVAD